MLQHCTPDEEFHSAEDPLVCATLTSILELCLKQINSKHPNKVRVNIESIWAEDYKSPEVDIASPIHVVYDGQPAIDTGRVRHQVYTDVYRHFVNNMYVRLFTGPKGAVRQSKPHVSYNWKCISACPIYL